MILLDNEREETIYGSGREPIATNNTMEIMAVLECMKRILKDRIRARPVIIFSDSQYVVNGMNQWMHTWARTDFFGVKNDELWREMFATAKKFNNIRARWVKGHNGNTWNEWCDRAAAVARKGRPRERFDKDTQTEGNEDGT